VIKVDVEGFEEEVLGGMGELLTSSTLRSVLIEGHFLKLEERGKMMAPSRVQKLLNGKGFRTRWITLTLRLHPFRFGRRVAA